MRGGGVDKRNLSSQNAQNSSNLTHNLSKNSQNFAQNSSDFNPQNSQPNSLNLAPSSKKPFNLAQSLEVAEHIDAKFADNFIALLTSLSDIVLFSAAAPHQGGTHHVNEQEPNYWAQKFARHGYSCFDPREHFWDDDKIECWYRQNVLIFAHKDKISLFSSLKAVSKPLYIVHPQIWEWRNQHFQGSSDLQTRYNDLERKYNKTLRRRVKRVWKKFYEWQKGFERKFRAWRKAN